MGAHGQSSVAESARTGSKGGDEVDDPIMKRLVKEFHPEHIGEPAHEGMYSVIV